MAAYYICHHMYGTNRIVLNNTRGVDIGGGGLDIYVVYFPWVMKLVTGPVYG